MKFKIFLLVFVILSLGATAQDRSKIKFGKVSTADLKKKNYDLDKSAAAVLIADIGTTEMVGNKKGGFSVQFNHYRRAHILNKNGYDIATVEIYLYSDGESEEELASLRAVTYNLENGKVEETKLNVKDAVFSEKVDKNRTIKRFTFPNIREGSIIEYEYRLLSDFTYNLPPWNFQGEYPCLWSEYNATIPEFYAYVMTTQGFHPLYINESKVRNAIFSVTSMDAPTGLTGVRVATSLSRTDFTAPVTEYRWVMKDVPVLKEEKFTSTLRNHIARIQFQLTELKPPFTPRTLQTTWPQFTRDLLKREDFGLELKRNNEWLGDLVTRAGGSANDDLGKAQNIFQYVRDHFTCTDHSAILMDNNLRNVVRSGSGNVAEINLLLAAMLRKAGLQADPVILSTRSNGFIYPEYPIVERLNYVIVRLSIGAEHFLADASQPWEHFGQPGYECYNGHARVVDEEATPLTLTTDSLTDKKVTSVLVINDREKGGLAGRLEQSPGYFESNDLRREIKEKGEDYFFDSLQKELAGDITITERSIDSLDRYDDPLSVRYNFKLEPGKPDIIYLNPMLGNGLTSNPFTAAERFYPVEIPYTIDETYLLRLDIPDGYEVEEMPKQVIVRLNPSGDGLFEYLLSTEGGVFSLRSHLLIRRTYFLPDEYEMLRNFYALVVKKHAEQIVFRKKK